MPVKFVAEVVKGLFGISEQNTDDAETETSVTVERETDGESTAESEESVGEPAEPEESGESAGEPAEPEESEESAGEPAEPEESEESAGEPVEEIRGIGPTYSERLGGIGIETVGELAGADTAEVADAAEVSESRAADWITQAQDR